MRGFWCGVHLPLEGKGFFDLFDRASFTLSLAVLGRGDLAKTRRAHGRRLVLGFLVSLFLRLGNLDAGEVVYRATLKTGARLAERPVSDPIRYEATPALPRGQVTRFQVELEAGLVRGLWILAGVALFAIQISIVLESAGAEPLAGLWVGLG